MHSIYGNNVGSLSSDAFTVNLSRGGCTNDVYNNSTITDTSAPRVQVYYYDTLLNRNLRMRAIISDYNGVDSAPGLKPMVHFRKHFNGDWLTATGNFVSGELKTGVWEFEIPISVMYPVYMNDTISFVLVAKEPGVAGKIGSFPAAGNSFSAITNTSEITNTNKSVRKDRFAPVITHTAIPNLKIATPIRLQVQIIDSTGVFNTGLYAPRVIAIFTNGVIVPNTTQYRDTAYGQLQTGTNKNGVWEFNFRPR